MEARKQQFIQIIDSKRGLIISLCKAYYSDIEDQKDAYQDIVLQLWKSFDSFIGTSDVSTWMYRVGLNTMLSKMRKRKRQVQTDPIEDVGLSTLPAVDDDLEMLKQLIHRLKGQNKAIVILYLEGYRNKEIAQMLSLTPTNVGTRLNRIKTTLKVKLKDQSYAVRRP